MISVLTDHRLCVVVCACLSAVCLRDRARASRTPPPLALSSWLFAPVPARTTSVPVRSTARLFEWCFGRRAMARRDERLDRSPPTAPPRRSQGLDPRPSLAATGDRTSGQAARLRSRLLLSHLTCPSAPSALATVAAGLDQQGAHWNDGNHSAPGGRFSRPLRAGRARTRCLLVVRQGDEGSHRANWPPPPCGHGV